MNRRELFDIVVVGAGMVGSAAALLLMRQGLRVALVEERAPRPWLAHDEVDLRVVALAPSSIKLFEDLDVWTSIRAARASAYRRMRVWDASAAGELNFDAADRGDAALGYIVEIRLIQHMLWQVLSASSVALFCPVKIVSLESAEQARIVVLADGARLHTRLVIAADGLTSPLREWSGIATAGHVYDQRAVVAHVATERSHEHTAWQRFLPGGPLAFLPLADGRCSIVWSAPTQQAEELLALDDVAFCTELGAAFDFRLGAIAACSARASFPLRLQLAERYIAERLVLMGDAAHVVHPLAGQGVNLGLRDVTALCDVLKRAVDNARDPGSNSTLRAYERQRRSENALAGWGLDVIHRLFGHTSTPLVMARGFGLAALNSLAPIKQRLMDHAAGRA